MFENRRMKYKKKEDSKRQINQTNQLRYFWKYAIQKRDSFENVYNNYCRYKDEKINSYNYADIIIIKCILFSIFLCLLLS